MRVQRRTDSTTLVGAGVRSASVWVPVSPTEDAVIRGVTEAQGWSVAGWIGAGLEFVEHVGPTPEGGGRDATAWARIADLGWVAAMAGHWMRYGEATQQGSDLVAAGLALERVCRVQPGACRELAVADNAAAWRFAEARAATAGPGWRPRPGHRPRVEVQVSEATRAILDSGVGSTGWRASDWVGTVAALAAGWLAVAGRTEAVALESWRARLDTVVLLLGEEARNPRAGQRLGGLGEWAGREVRAVTAGVGLVAAQRPGPRAGVGVEQVEAVLGWPARLDVTPARHDAGITGEGDGR